MTIERRTFLAGAAAAALPTSALAAPVGGMYGLTGKMMPRPGQRGALVSILLEGVSGMPGCLSYVVAEDPANPEVIWITEAWQSKEAHAASLSLPAVRAAIAKARPLIAGMEVVAETVPVGGHGLGPVRP